ncbi:hypothetical protein FPV67DRAFT_1430157 [Lyophyllum atratum]|nr:hypothetical protein FPV67DRAFT_1430157 [Lyophyllum atratum]
MIHATDHSVVYRACLGDELEAVVLKFSVDDESIADLRREATAYTSVLKDLQGSVIPSFYGIYHGTCSHGIDVSCIVLQDCGDSIKTKFRELPIEERHAILEQLGKFHIVSKCHPRDLAERNVVAKDGQYRLIDFHTLIEHHCEFDGRWGFGEYMRMDFGCDLLAEPALIEFRVWKRSKCRHMYACFFTLTKKQISQRG